MSTFCKGWYVLYTQYRHEKKVCEKLDQKNIKTFLPIQKTVVIKNGSRSYGMRLLFPNYVFVLLKTVQDYFVCTDLDGVLSFVRFEKKLARVDEALINNLELALNTSDRIDLVEKQFNPGELLTIIKGPLQGVVGEVVECNGNKKLLIRINILKRNILLSLPIENASAHAIIK